MIRKLIAVILAFILMHFFWPRLSLVAAQGTGLQDSTLNNLVHPSGYQSCRLGDLGRVEKMGHSKQAIIIVSGMGFGAEAYRPLAEHFQSSYTVYLVTPAGFGGSPAPPMPDSSALYADLPWTKALATGILHLIEREKLIKPILMAHFVTSTQAAFYLSVHHADKIGKVVIIGGAPYRYYPTPRNNNWNDLDWDKEIRLSAAQRSRATEKQFAPLWFKTVTKKTFDSFMWTPGDYCRDTLTGQMLFQEVAATPLQIMIRYILEWGAYDAAGQYPLLKCPMLVLIPDFDGVLNPNARDSLSCSNAEAKKYLDYYHRRIWKEAEQAGNPMLQFKTISHSRLFTWLDNPKKTFREIERFIKKTGNP